MAIDDTTAYLEIVGDSITENLGSLPYVMHVRNAYRWLSNTRMTIFLKSLDFSLNEILPESKERFEEYINSNMGREKLAEYSDTILRTSSRSCIAAMGILYSDSLNNKLFSEEFKRIACFAFQGATEPLIDAFIALCDMEPDVSESPYPLCILSEEKFRKDAKLRNVIGSPEDAFASVYELIRRGLFLPGHTPFRVAGTGWHIIFGVTDISRKLKSLLLEAKRYLGTHEIG
jgi:hypothetical protein